MLANLIEFVSNHYVLSSLFVALLILLFITETRKGGKSLSNRELTALVSSGGRGVGRARQKEFDAGHIVDALNIPYEKLVSRTGELEKHKAKTIIVVDAMGQHAGTACRELQKAGFTAAKLSGGISSWRGDNLPVVK